MADFEEPDPEPTDLEPDQSDLEPDQSDLEPEEFDPDSLGPSAPDLSANASNADPETARLFWTLVMVFNISLLGVSLGVMFVVFQQNFQLGGQLFLGGSILFAYGYYRYRKFQDDT